MLRWTEITLSPATPIRPARMTADVARTLPRSAWRARMSSTVLPFQVGMGYRSGSPAPTVWAMLHRDGRRQLRSVPGHRDLHRLRRAAPRRQRRGRAGPAAAVAGRAGDGQDPPRRE